MTAGPHEPTETREAISADTDDWRRQFIKHLELHLLDACRVLSPHPSDSELKQATAQAILKTYLDSGMEVDAVIELLGRAAIERCPVPASWSDALNERRFALIDKEIQETLTPAERVELAELTRILREHIDAESNLPMQGVRDLHRKLLHFETRGESH